MEKISLSVDTWHEGDVHEITKAPPRGHQKQANRHNEHEYMRSLQLPAFQKEQMSMFLLENAVGHEHINCIITSGQYTLSLNSQS